MAFHVYILRCADSSFYTGHFDDLNVRLELHITGIVPCYTSSRLPVRLVWEQEFATRLEAIGAEEQMKRWSGAKKEAVLVDDWAEISRLSHVHGSQALLPNSKKTVRPAGPRGSTSSPRTDSRAVRREFVEAIDNLRDLT